MKVERYTGQFHGTLDFHARFVHGERQAAIGDIPVKQETPHRHLLQVGLRAQVNVVQGQGIEQREV